MNQNYLNPIWVLKRTFLRISGREARRLFSEVNELKEDLATSHTQLQSAQHELAATLDQVNSLHSELETNQAQLQSAQHELAATSHELSMSRESRDTRIHRFVAEALSLAAPLTPSRVTKENLKITGSLLGKFTEFGSDKEVRHNYAEAYIEILTGVESPHILEIGLGSLNGFPYGGLPPGGSIKAWRDAYPTSVIVGADIDPESVSAISEVGFIVDQTSDDSLDAFTESIRQYSPFDIVVDDGFHDPHANFRTLLKVFPLVAKSGAYVIEDVHETLIDFWRVIAATLNADLELRDLRNDRPTVEDNILLIFR